MGEVFGRGFLTISGYVFQFDFLGKFPGKNLVLLNCPPGVTKSQLWYKIKASALGQCWMPSGRILSTVRGAGVAFSTINPEYVISLDLGDVPRGRSALPKGRLQPQESQPHRGDNLSRVGAPMVWKFGHDAGNSAYCVNHDWRQDVALEMERN